VQGQGWGMKKNIGVLKIAVLAASLSALASCSKDSGSPQASDLQAANIVGGKKVSTAYQKKNGIVALIINTEDQKQELCSGTLIAKNIVLTAAHCLVTSGSKIRSIAVVFGPNLDTATKEMVRHGIKGLPNKDFLSGLDANPNASWNDIALIKLDADAPADFSLVKLADAQTKLNSKASLIEAGFGNTQAARETSGDTSGALKQVSGIQLMSISVDGKELVLKEQNKGSCNGDSGGPAFIKNVDGSLTQVGIDSRGTDKDSCLGIGIYTNILAHLDWIKTQSDLLNPANTPNAK
jgi:secreted trypsin-like serine protease